MNKYDKKKRILTISALMKNTKQYQSRPIGSAARTTCGPDSKTTGFGPDARFIIISGLCMKSCAHLVFMYFRTHLENRVKFA